jgi:uncharacterized protein (TIGR03382 family)
VRRSLDVDITTLGTRLKLANIVLVPALLSLSVLAAAWLRRRRRSLRPATSDRP